MQPYFLPYMGYFQMVHNSDLFVFYDDVRYIKGGWINRNKISNNGYITIPVKKFKKDDNINDVFVDWESRSVNKLYKNIRQTYSKKIKDNKNVFDIIENIFDVKPDKISDCSIMSVELFSDYLGLETKFKRSSEESYRKFTDKSDNIIEICNKEKIYNYVNPVGGVDLYDKSYFKENNINLSFIKGKSSLSILDVCMNNDIDKLKEDINKYELL